MSVATFGISTSPGRASRPAQNALPFRRWLGILLSLTTASAIAMRLASQSAAPPMPPPDAKLLEMIEAIHGLERHMQTETEPALLQEDAGILNQLVSGLCGLLVQTKAGLQAEKALMNELLPRDQNGSPLIREPALRLAYSIAEYETR